MKVEICVQGKNEIVIFSEMKHILQQTWLIKTEIKSFDIMEFMLKVI